MRVYIKKFHFLFVFIVIFFLLVGCNVDKNPISIYSGKYEGKWCWIKTEGGLFPKVMTPEEGVTIIIQYNNKNIFRIFRNDSLKVIAHYTIEKADYGRDRISYDNIVTYDYYFNRDTEYAKIYSDTLDIWDGDLDGFFSWYIKI
jgi:hypothetical protein